MPQQATAEKRWNLFARELEDLLRKRDRELNDLMSEGLLHSEKVRRLKQSLVYPRFHLLSPEDLEQVITVFCLSGEEQLRLRAAILATAVEETLMNRIDPENALRAAEEIFPILLRALQKRLKQQRGLAATRRPMMEEPRSDDAMELILERFDHAMLALHLSRQGSTLIEQMEQGTMARDRFLAVLADLEALCASDPALENNEAWQLWHQETQKGLVAVSHVLQRLQS
jgi:hypothetical protein